MSGIIHSTPHPLLGYGLPHRGNYTYLHHKYGEFWNRTSTPSFLSFTNETPIDVDYPCIAITNETHVLTSHQIYLYSSLIFVFVGLIGNMLSVAVFTSKEMRPISSNFYLLMLAVSDSMYLVSVFLTKILTTLRCLHFKDSEADIVNRNTFVCKILQFMQDFFSDYSTCLILAFTVERFIAVYLPVKFKDICTVHRARMVCIGMLVLIGITIGPYHFMHIGLHQDVDICIILLEYEDIFSYIYVVEALIYRIVPVFIIAVLNVFIIMKVSKVTRERRRRKAQVNSLCNGKKKTKKQDKSMQLTVMLILVSSSYIIVYIPVLVHFILYKLMRTGLIEVSRAGMDIAQNYTRTLYISGFAINFFLYTMSGRVFREQLELILCESLTRHKRESAVSQVEMTTLV